MDEKRLLERLENAIFQINRGDPYQNINLVGILQDCRECIMGRVGLTAEAIIRKLKEDLAETHEDEIEHNHYGDGPEHCLYCQHIHEAECLLLETKGA